MRIAVAGANGLVGARLCAQLASAGHGVLGLARGELRAGPHAPFEWAGVELTRAEEVKAVLSRFRPDAIVNAASLTDVDGCEARPREAFAANAGVAATLAIEAREHSAHLVQISTDYVFDGQAGPYAETDAPNPLGVYAVTKLLGEHAVRSLCASWAIARTAVVYGWPPAGRPNFGAWLVSSLAEGRPVKLFCDQYVSPTLALNLAEMLVELTERRLPGVWHLSGAAIVSRVEFGAALCARFGFDPGLLNAARLTDLALASPRPPRSGLRVEKAQRELAAKPQDLATALERFFLEWKRV